MSTDYLFVYGTLRHFPPDEFVNSLLDPPVFFSQGHIQASLYEVDNYPGAVLSDNPKEHVIGDLYRISNENLFWEKLDDYEECSAKFPEPHEYKRQQVEVRLPDGSTVTSWVYLYNHDINKLQRIPSGDYLRYQRHPIRNGLSKIAQKIGPWCLLNLLWLVPLLYQFQHWYHRVDVQAMEKNVSQKGGPDPFFCLYPLHLVYLSILLLSLAIIPLSIWLFRYKPYRMIALVLLLSALTSIKGCRDIHAYNGNPRREAFTTLGARLMPLVEAIKAYESDNQKPPPSLNVLVPKYLPQLPSTQMGSYKTYNYYTGQKAASYGGNPWIIRMDVGYGMGFDEFLYLPKQNYDTVLGGEPLGEWCYMHE